MEETETPRTKAELLDGAAERLSEAARKLNLAADKGNNATDAQVDLLRQEVMDIRARVKLLADLD